jgi:hypothetical protein
VVGRGALLETGEPALVSEQNAVVSTTIIAHHQHRETKNTINIILIIITTATQSALCGPNISISVLIITGGNKPVPSQ